LTIIVSIVNYVQEQVGQNNVNQFLKEDKMAAKKKATKKAAKKATKKVAKKATKKAGRKKASKA
jgi:hypothetical protein